MWKKANSLIQSGIRDLFPAYFALVMATGIVSIACHLLAMDFLAFPLFYLNQFFYVVLWLFMLARLFHHFPRAIADLSNHSAGAGFFTLVAGTNVLGSQFVILNADGQTAFALWVFGFALWIILIYAFFAVMTLKEEKPPLEKGVLEVCTEPIKPTPTPINNQCVKVYETEPANCAAAGGTWLTSYSASVSGATQRLSRWLCVYSTNATVLVSAHMYDTVGPPNGLNQCAPIAAR